jgi:hypothetical protein
MFDCVCRLVSAPHLLANVIILIKVIHFLHIKIYNKYDC